MKFLVDNQLPQALVRFFRRRGLDCHHVLDVGLAEASDEDICRYARAEGRIIVSKDEDFLYLSSQFKTPITLLWVRLGNCRTAALISNRGAIEWCCLPYFDSDSYFAALMDRSRGGSFSLSPAVPFTVRQSYVRDTNVLETVFKTALGKVRLLDCFTATTERRAGHWGVTEHATAAHAPRNPDRASAHAAARRGEKV